MRLAASQPPEARGLGRDGVRLLVATPDGMVHARFGDLPRFLSAGDLLVINTSATIAAAVDGRRGDGRPVVVHFSSPLRGKGPVTRERPAGDRRGRERPARHSGWSSCGAAPPRPGP
jgi:S-adenosylmethionine:tRNA ribosyltransferase-isomerase